MARREFSPSAAANPAATKTSRRDMFNMRLSLSNGPAPGGGLAYCDGALIGRRGPLFPAPRHRARRLITIALGERPIFRHDRWMTGIKRPLAQSCPREARPGGYEQRND